MHMNHQHKKPWYKKWYIWLIIIVVLIGIGGAAGGNTDTKVPTTNTESSSSEEKTKDEPKEQKEEKWNVETAYAGLTDGMTKAEAETAIGKTSDNCSETSSEYVGTIETCNYGGIGDNGMIMVQYQNDKLSTKTKTLY